MGGRVSATPTVNNSMALEFIGVAAGYRGSEVLRNVSISVPVASLTALLGPNGAGKTTLMRVASGVLSPTAGQVFIGGNNVLNERPYERVKRGLCDIPEGRGIFPSLSVKENLILQAPRNRQKECIALAAETFPELERRFSQIAGNLSGGEQQMLALCRAYLRDPDVVLLDEVSLGLAPLIVDRIYEFILMLKDRGAALLVVEQYANRILDLADQVLLLDRGSIVFAGSTTELQGVDIFSRYLGIELDA